MKDLSSHFVRPLSPAGRAFTLVEMMVAVTIFSLIILMTIAVQIYALRVYTLSATKLTATAEARVTMNDLRDQVRQARIVYVGNYVTNFVPISNGNSQQGNALMIYPTTTSTNSYTLVYWQTNSVMLLTYSNGDMAVNNDIADFVTNQVVFDAENFMGSVLTTNENNYLIHMTLDFAQWEYPIASIGTNAFNAYDYYQLNTVMTRRDTD